MTKGRRVAALLLLAIALGLAVLGQYYFFHRREYLWDGVVFYLLAVLCFVGAWWLAYPRGPRAPRHPPTRLGTWLQERPAPAMLLACGLCLSFAATLLSQGRALDQPTGDVVILWVLGMGAVAMAALWPASWPPPFYRDCRARWQRARRRARLAPGGTAPRKGSTPARSPTVSWLDAIPFLFPWGTWLEAATVAALTGLALVLRVAALDSVPYTLGGDEAWHGLLARQVLTGQLRNPFDMGYMSMPTFFYWPLSWSLWLVGNDMIGLRLPAALVGTVTVPLLYLFARDLWGRRTAVITTVFLATYDYHVHYSRLGANNVWDPLFILLTLWMLDRGLRGGRGQEEAKGQGSKETGEQRDDLERTARYFVLAGLVMGSSVYFYTGARLLPVLVAVYVVYVWLQRRRWIERLGLHLVLLVLAFLVAAGPMLSYALTHPDEWNARINQVGIIQSGWLAREPGLTGKTTPRILAEQFLRATGAFHVFADRTVWYGAERPLLGFLPGILSMVGMAWALVHWRDRRYFLVLIWFWSVIITGGMLTESPPSSQRLVIAIPAVALLVAFGLEQPVRLARRLLGFHRRWENLALVLLTVILAVGSVRFYFVEFTPSGRYGSQNGETATMIGHYLRDLDGEHAEYRAYFLGAPRIYWNFGSMTFLAPNVPGQDVVEPLEAPPDFVDEAASAAGQGIVFIFLPERAGELAWVQQALPNGQVREFHDAADRLRFTVYKVP